MPLNWRDPVLPTSAAKRVWAISNGYIMTRVVQPALAPAMKFVAAIDVHWPYPSDFSLPLRIDRYKSWYKIIMLSAHAEIDKMINDDPVTT